MKPGPGPGIISARSVPGVTRSARGVIASAAKQSRCFCFWRRRLDCHGPAALAMTRGVGYAVLAMTQGVGYAVLAMARGVGRAALAMTSHPSPRKARNDKSPVTARSLGDVAVQGAMDCRATLAMTRGAGSAVLAMTQGAGSVVLAMTRVSAPRGCLAPAWRMWS